VADQNLEHGELARRQVDGSALRAGAAGAQVEHDGARAQHGALDRPLVA
jgi:hypothetical protein